MKLLNYIFLAVLMAGLLLPSTSLLSQVDRSQAPEAGPAPLIELGESTLLSLPNGLQIIVVENHRLPKVSWTLSLEYSPIFEGNKAGMLDLFGELMRSGTENKPKPELDEEIDFLGAHISVNPKGMRGSSLTKHTNELLSLMSEVLFSPSFPEKELNRLRTQALSGLLASESSPSEISSVLTRVLKYGEAHPYGEVTTSKSLDLLTREDFVTFHKTYFKPNIAYLIVVGDIDPNTAYAKANTFFGAWKRGDIPYKRWDSPARPQTTRTCLVPLEGSVQSVIKLTHVVSMPPNSDDAIAASVMNSILGGGAFSGRLMQNLREDKAFTYGARSIFKTDPLVGSFTAYADVRNEVTDSSIVEFLYEIRRIMDEPVDSASLAVTKNYMTGSFARSLERPTTAARFALNIERYNLPKDYYSTYLEKLSAVTIEDVQRVAKNYIRPDQIFITCVGNESVIESLKKFSTHGVVELFDAYGQPLIERTAASAGVTVESVINDHYNAIGGVNTISKLKGVARTGSIEMGGGMTLNFVHTANYKKGRRGAHTSFSISGQEVVTNVVTDNGGYSVQMGPRSPTEGNELAIAQWEELDPTYLLNTSGLGLKTELLGVEQLNGKSYHVVKLHKEGVINLTCYFDKMSKMLSSTKAITESENEGTMVVTTKYNNYLDLGDGILFPMEVITTAGTQRMAIRIGSVTINPDIDLTLFNLN
ncbi:MAG TPA: insulinase family protein [Flavobacteriales bacterium]|jgi:predicted Zn-dependent peptidase|nr:insulinase family protein [Flavobacteriales bacterium]